MAFLFVFKTKQFPKVVNKTIKMPMHNTVVPHVLGLVAYVHEYKIYFNDILNRFLSI